MPRALAIAASGLFFAVLGPIIGALPLIFFWPVVLLFAYQVGFVPAFIAGAIFAWIYPRHVGASGSADRRVAWGAVCGALATLPFTVQGLFSWASPLTSGGVLIGVFGIVAGGVCAYALPIRKELAASSETPGAPAAGDEAARDSWSGWALVAGALPLGLYPFVVTSASLALILGLPSAGGGLRTLHMVGTLIYPVAYALAFVASRRAKKRGNSKQQLVFAAAPLLLVAVLLTISWAAATKFR